MALKIVEKLLPVGREMMKLKVPQRKRKAMVDADQRGNILGQFLYQPFGDAAPRPILLGRWRRRNFDRRRISLGPSPSSSLLAFVRPNSRCRWCGRRRAWTQSGIVVAAFDERHRPFEVFGLGQRDLKIAGAKMPDLGNVAGEAGLKRHAGGIDLHEQQYLGGRRAELDADEVLDPLESDV